MSLDETDVPQTDVKNPLASQDPPGFHRWHRLVSSWVCQLCDCTQNHRSILDPTCKSCAHVHVPARAQPAVPDGGEGDGRDIRQE
jgi:rubredoxin